MDSASRQKVNAHMELFVPQDAHGWVSGLTQRVLDSS